MLKGPHESLMQLNAKSRATSNFANPPRMHKTRTAARHGPHCTRQAHELHIASPMLLCKRTSYGESHAVHQDQHQRLVGGCLLNCYEEAEATAPTLFLHSA